MIISFLLGFLKLKRFNNYPKGFNLIIIVIRIFMDVIITFF